MQQTLHRLNVVAGAAPELASLVFVSTDTNGTPGDLNKAVQKSFGVDFTVDPKLLSKQGYQIVQLPRGPIIVWIVTVGGQGKTVDQLEENLQSALPDALEQLLRLEIGKTLWLPLMGTGAGRLDLEESAIKTFEFLAKELSHGDYPELDINISLHPKIDQETLNRITKIAHSERFSDAWSDEIESRRGSGESAEDAGFGLRFQRETSEELALDRDIFALALARLFKIADGEFSLALLGRWGSGKTTIAKKIIQYLKDEEAYSVDFRKVFRRPLSEQSSRTYDVVEFNAWRYRRQPELWIWLYESFVSTYLSCWLGARIIRPIRAGIQKYGFTATLIRLLFLAFTALPFMWLTLALPYGIAVFGLTGLAGLFFLARRWQGSLRLLVDRYGLVASHHDKLGMQATIGEDLKALVKSWARSSQFSTTQKVVFPASMAIVAAFWGTTLIGGTDGIIVSMLKDFLNTVLGPESENFSEQLTLSVSLLALIIWCSIAALFSFAVVTDYARVDRILLVVDDLDRCPKEEIVDLIDGIKLMLDDEEVGSLVQALVLADDLILETAIRQRFAKLEDNMTSENQRGAAGWKAAVREHMEKVFLCHVSIPVLDAGDLEPLVDVFGREFGTNELTVSTIQPDESIGIAEPRRTSISKSESSKKLVLSRQALTTTEVFGVRSPSVARNLV